jgi:DNA-binding NtrC family response regulator
VLQNYDWPGNIRELENVIERLAIMTENGAVTAADVIPDFNLNGEAITMINFARSYFQKD